MEEIKNKLEENIDPNKVVCVTFTLEDVEIESRGDVIFLTINTDVEQRAALLEAFRTIEWRPTRVQFGYYYKSLFEGKPNNTTYDEWCCLIKRVAADPAAATSWQRLHPR